MIFMMDIDWDSWGITALSFLCTSRARCGSGSGPALRPNEHTQTSRKLDPFLKMRAFVCAASPLLSYPLRHASRVLAAPAHRRPLASAQSAAVESKVDATILPKKSRVAAVREQLKQDSRTLDDFLGLPSDAANNNAQAKSGGCSSSSTVESSASREEEMHRSVLGQLKPDYVKADGSFKRLRCSRIRYFAFAPFSTSETASFLTRTLRLAISGPSWPILNTSA